jgi:hypothetical protein
MLSANLRNFRRSVREWKSEGAAISQATFASAWKRIMSHLRFFAAVLVLAAGALTCTAADNDSPRVPVLLELFTSEGCSSCPPADRLLQLFDQKQPVHGADLIVLSEHVDYWDRLGWKDPFSSSLFTSRQQEYSYRLQGDGVYTPELVVDGRFGFVGSDGRKAVSAIQEAMREPKIPIAISNASRDGNQVTVHIEVPADERRLKGGRAVLYVALADNRAESQVARGENAGRSLAHVGVVRVLKQVGTIDLEAATARNVMVAIKPGTGANGSRLVAFIQDAKTGWMLAVTAQKL